MKYFFITGLALSALSVMANEPSIFVIKHLPSTKTVAEIPPSQCDNKTKPLSEAKDLNFKCLIIKGEKEQLKFFTLFDDKNEIVTIKGTVEETRALKNSATVGFKTDQLEVNF